MADNVPQLGQLCPADAKRDAVHVAVAPVVAGEDLNPSERVILDAEGKAFSRHVGGPPPVGIVDPYLDDCVFKGQTFWLCLFPGTATSLRHVWTHPAFRAKFPVADSLPASMPQTALEASDSLAKARRWS